MDIQQPVNTVYKKTTVAAILVAYLAALLSVDVWAKLYKNNIIPTSDTEVGDLQECDFGGYAKILLSTTTAVNMDAAGNAYALFPLSVFQCNGTSGNSVFGAYMTKLNGTVATATNPGNAGNYAAAFVVTAGGTGYTVAPRVRLTGATGANATAHAIVVGGIVVDIVLDNPGNGAYTTFTVVIDPPEQLVTVSPFANAVNINLATDAVAYVAELSIPAITI